MNTESNCCLFNIFFHSHFYFPDTDKYSYFAKFTGEFQFLEIMVNGIAFLLSLSVRSLLGRWKGNWALHDVVILRDHAELLRSGSFCQFSPVFCIDSYIICKKKQFYSAYRVVTPLISFSCLTEVKSAPMWFWTRIRRDSLTFFQLSEGHAIISIIILVCDIL